MVERAISISELFSRRAGRRRLVTPSGEGVRGLYPSSKNGRMVEYESRGERDAAEVLELAAAVLSYREQPGRERWWDGERMRRYTPDFLVVTLLGAVFLEIKPASVARRPKVRRRHALIRASLTTRGMPFVVWTERHLRSPVRAVGMLLAMARRSHR